MSTDSEKSKGWKNMKVRNEYGDRLKKVRIQTAAQGGPDLSDTGLLNDLVNEGLTKRERKLGIPTA